MCLGRHVLVYVWRSEGSLWESALSFYHEGPVDWVCHELSGKCPYSQRLLACPVVPCWIIQMALVFKSYKQSRTDLNLLIFGELNQLLANRSYLVFWISPYFLLSMWHWVLLAWGLIHYRCTSYLRTPPGLVSFIYFDFFLACTCLTCGIWWLSTKQTPVYTAPRSRSSALPEPQRSCRSPPDYCPTQAVTRYPPPNPEATGGFCSLKMEPTVWASLYLTPCKWNTHMLDAGVCLLLFNVLCEYYSNN